MRKSALITASILGASALILSGCSTGGGDDKKEGRVSINSLLGVPDYENVDWQDQERQIQALIAECMREEGWEYIPVEQPDAVYEWSPEDELESYKKQGFGIVYYTLYQGTDEYEDPWAGWVDPNQEYIESLSESEMTAYYESLYGSEEEQNEDIVYEIDPETGEEYGISYGWGAGCQGEAYAEVYGNDITQTPEYQEAMMGYWEDLNDRYMADPRVVKLNESWSSCMKKAGYDFKNQEDLWDKGFNTIQERHDEIVPNRWADPMEGWTDEEINDFWENATQEEIDALYNVSVNLTDDQRSQLESLLQEEIDLAVAQYECSKPYNEEMAEIYADVEEKFALEHEDELRALAAQFADSQK
jgi:hypothetical protein